MRKEISTQCALHAADLLIGLTRSLAKHGFVFLVANVFRSQNKKRSLREILIRDDPMFASTA